MTLSDASQVILALTGLAGALSGVFGVWIAHKARANPYQEKLFERRLNAYAEIHAAVTEVYHLSQGLIPAEGESLDHQPFNILKRNVSAVADLRRLLAKYDLFVSFDLLDASHNVLEAGLAINHLHSADIPFAEMRHKYTELDRQLDVGFTNVLGVARKDLGLEELTTRTQLLISKGR